MLRPESEGDVGAKAGVPPYCGESEMNLLHRISACALISPKASSFFVPGRVGATATRHTCPYSRRLQTGLGQAEHTAFGMLNRPAPVSARPCCRGLREAGGRRSAVAASRSCQRVVAAADKECWLLDYGAGNVRSVRNAVKHLGYNLREVRRVAVAMKNTWKISLFYYARYHRLRTLGALGGCSFRGSALLAPLSTCSSSVASGSR